MKLGCGGMIGIVAIALVFIWLFEQPLLLAIVLGIIALLIGLFFLKRQSVLDQRVREGHAMARRIDALARGFTPLTDIAMSVRPEEKAFYRLEGVELREYRSGGSSYKGGYAGGNLSLTQGFSVSAGGNRGRLTHDEEESTTVDVGTAIFTNQRVVFSGPKQTREWELAKLLNIDVGENGFVVSISASNSQRTNALAGSMELGITPGVLFSIALESFQEGEEAARAFAIKTAQDFRSQAEDYFAKRGKSI